MEARQETQNALFLDNFVVELAGGQKTGNEEVAIAVDKPDGIYQKNELVRLVLRAEIASDKEKEELELSVVRDLDQTIAKTVPVSLRKIGTSGGSCNLFEGETRLDELEYGSFSLRCQRGQERLKSAGGDSVVLHPVDPAACRWKLGGNQWMFPALRGPDWDDAEEYYQLGLSGGFERMFQLERQAGLNLNRLWASWRAVEPVENHLTPDILGPVMAMNRKYGMDVLFTLVGNMNYHGRGEIQYFPKYLLQYQKFTKQVWDGPLFALQPPMEVFERYLNFVLDNWGSQVSEWEVFNEPGPGKLSPEAYLSYMQRAYQLIKKRFPQAKVAGNGMTGDTACAEAQPLRWCDMLAAVNPEYEQSLDAVAFHPYTAALDWQEGSYFKYRDNIESIRNKLKYRKPMWNTECFFLARAKNPKPYQDQTDFGAGEAQRHILDGMLNGVMVNTPFETFWSFYKHTPQYALPTPNEVFAGMNALAFMLRNTDDIEAVPVNKYIKAGIFSRGASDQGVAFAYDLRPEGCLWILPGDLSGIAIHDIFGNRLTPQGKLPLGYNPYWLTGGMADLKRLLRPENFRVTNNLLVNARAWRDRIHLEVANVSGIGGAWDLRVSPLDGWRFPDHAQLTFNDRLDRNSEGLEGVMASASSPSKPKLWKASIDASNNDNAIEGVVNLLPATGDYEIPMDKEKPLLLTLSRGSQVSVWADDRNLYIQAPVSEGSPTPAKNGNLWEGDALELFIDPAPFTNLDQPKSEKLNVYQFIFAGAPSTTGVERLKFHQRQGGGLPTDKLGSRVEKTPSGHIILATIPWEEIQPEGIAGDIWGIDLEVDRVTATGTSKESLGGKPGKSYRERLHYPLFKIPVVARQHYLDQTESALRNADFTKESHGKPDFWNVEGRSQLKLGKEYGFNGNGGLSIAVAEPGPKMNRVSQSVPVTPGNYHRCLAQVLLKYENIEIPGERTGEPGVWFAVDIYDGKSSLRKVKLKPEAGQQAVAGSSQWCLLQLPADIPAEATRITVSAGMGNHTSGTVRIDHIKLICQ